MKRHKEQDRKRQFKDKSKEMIELETKMAQCRKLSAKRTFPTIPCLKINLKHSNINVFYDPPMNNACSLKPFEGHRDKVDIVVK